jgi:glycosyltransferase involved in cell wall biosynthesis
VKYSIYTSCFNIEKNNFFYWQKTIPKWVNFLNNGLDGEIIIAINNSEDNTLNILNNFIKNFNCIKIIESNFAYDDYAFDGKIKNEALKNCKNDICIGIDLDEYLSPNKKDWDIVADQLLNSDVEAVFIPVIDLCKSVNEYKSIGVKWYMHKQGLHRGVWKLAELSNGKIDIKKSDTCELLNNDGDLCKCANLLPQLTPEMISRTSCPFIIHLGWLNWKDRKNQNKTWQPVWSNRAGFEVNDIIHEEKNFEQIIVFKHNLNI